MSTLDSPERGAAVLAGPAPRILVLSAPYYRDVVDGMLHGARRRAGERGGAALGGIKGAQLVVSEVMGRISTSSIP